MVSIFFTIINNNLRHVIFILTWLIVLPAYASPEQDQTQIRQFYKAKFPQLELADYRNGIYAIDPIARQTWQAIEEFPPYETAIDEGKKLVDTVFTNGKSYADCFPDRSEGIANRYPQWDKTRNEVITLAMAINDCRTKHHEPPLAYDKGDMVNLLAYFAYISRDKPIAVSIPNNPRAITAYEQGKAFYYQRHGQLNFACSTCHIQNVGKRLRSELLTPSLGHTSNWPTYRLKWGETGTLHRRFAECLTQIRAKPFAEQSIEFRNLEYFLAYMGNGVPISGPSVRK